MLDQAIAFFLDRFNFCLTYGIDVVFWIDPRDEHDRLLDRSRKKEKAMHPVHFLFEDIYRKHWGIPRPKRNQDAGKEAPVRPRIHPLQRLTLLP